MGCGIMVNNDLFEKKLKKYLVARDISVVDEKQKEREDAVFRKGYIKGVNDGHCVGLRKGFITGAMITILGVGTLVAGFTGVKGYVETKTATNPSVTAGYTAVISGTHRASDPQYYWYDYSGIALNFDEKEMDFDSFVYGVFKKVGWNKESTLECMDKLFHQLNLNGYTDSNSFFSYCKEKGLCKEVDGKLVVDTDKYMDAIQKYLLIYNELTENEDKVEQFKQSK